jgi:hypothetical protein
MIRFDFVSYLGSSTALIIGRLSTTHFISRWPGFLALLRKPTLPLAFEEHPVSTFSFGGKCTKGEKRKEEFCVKTQVLTLSSNSNFAQEIQSNISK